MPNKPKVWAIIPARSGSKGLPKKNIKIFSGKPLIHWSIDAALKSDLVNGVYVSTDCSEISEISKKSGAQVPFLRPVELAEDHSSVLDAIKDMISKIDEINEDDYLLLLQPTSPLRTTEHINESLSQFFELLEKDTETMISVMKAPQKMGWLLSQTEQYIDFCFQIDTSNPQRQKLPTLFLPNGSLFLLKIKHIDSGFYNQATRFYEMSEDESIDIDTLEEFNLAEAIFNRLKNE